MPLDLGAVTEFSLDTARRATRRTAAAPANIGAVLRAERERRGQTLQAVADLTRIRASYLAAIEDLKLDQLPSRPFTIGYVRAYAQALGLDPEAAITRFKRDAPEASEPLRAPIGVSRERDPRWSIFAAGAALVLSAVLVWNLAQHAVAEDGPAVPVVPETAIPAAPSVAPGSAVVLSRAQPAPQESQAPVPYVTPGLVPVDPNAPPVAEGATPAAAVATPVDADPVRAAFNPRGAIYGAEPRQSVVTLQARKPASLIVRGSDGAVYFARQLAAGEAYRAPLVGGLTVDVSDPSAFDVYANGEHKGALQAAQTVVSRLAG